jgi:diguanylate cyclase
LGTRIVTGLLDEHERTLAFAEVALGQMRALGQCAIPRNYEIWYVYATGYNPALNKIINETLAHNGKLSESDLEQIHETYLSPGHSVERIDKVGARIVGEIEQVVQVIAGALSNSSNFGAGLDHASKKLAQGVSDPDSIRSVIESLLKSTRDMQNSNNELEARLSVSKAEIKNLQQNLDAIRAESLTDPLTALGNRKYFDRALSEAMTSSKQSGEPLSLLMFDIDRFKQFNDNYGHLTGDQVLRLVAMSLKQNVKGQDITSRYGGEEFSVVLPNTGLRSALTVADQIRRAVMSKELKKKSTGEVLGRVTISVGVALLHPNDDAHSLIDRADSCLYAAKRNGRNRVICETDPQYQPDSHSQVA